MRGAAISGEFDSSMEGDREMSRKKMGHSVKDSPRRCTDALKKRKLETCKKNPDNVSRNPSKIMKTFPKISAECTRLSFRKKLSSLTLPDIPIRIYACFCASCTDSPSVY